jgi:hypothetical protein
VAVGPFHGAARPVAAGTASRALAGLSRVQETKLIGERSGCLAERVERADNLRAFRTLQHGCRFDRRCLDRVPAVVVADGRLPLWLGWLRAGGNEGVKVGLADAPASFPDPDRRELAAIKPVVNGLGSTLRYSETSWTVKNSSDTHRD